MQVTMTFPGHITAWVNDRNIFREDATPEDILMACILDAYEDDRHGEDNERGS